VGTGLHRFAVHAACALLLGACAISTPLPDLAKNAPAAFRNAPQTQGPPGPVPDLEHWWHAFDDAQLDRLIERALAQNLTLQQARLRLVAARALQHKSGTQFKPQVSFHTFAQPDPNGSTSYFEIGFDAEWEFGFFGRARTVPIASSCKFRRTGFSIVSSISARRNLRLPRAPLTQATCAPLRLAEYTLEAAVSVEP